MNKKTNEEMQLIVEKATAGDKKALETLVADVRDMVFNVSLRMLGTFAENDYASVFVSGRQLIYNVGIQYRFESSEKL